MVNEWTDRNERTPDGVERHYMEVWESIRRDPEIHVLGYVNLMFSLTSLCMKQLQ